jgi:hypothetical protein
MKSYLDYLYLLAKFEPEKAWLIGKNLTMYKKCEYLSNKIFYEVEGV